MHKFSNLVAKLLSHYSQEPSISGEFREGNNRLESPLLAPEKNLKEQNVGGGNMTEER